MYEAYGGIVLSTGSSENNRLANTKERDFSIGLDNHGFRYFDPEVGRYISPDPLGYPNGLNNWLYVNDNPICRIDPLGLGWWERFTGALQMVGGAVEAVTGMALCAAPEPVLTKVGGGLLAVHGADNMSTGWRKVWTGQDQRTLTSTGIKKGLTTVGVPDKEAGLIADGADAGIGLGGTTRAITILNRANRLQKLTAEGEKMLESGSRLTGEAARSVKGGLSPAQIQELEKTGSVKAEMGQLNPEQLRTLTQTSPEKLEYGITQNLKSGELRYVKGVSRENLRPGEMGGVEYDPATERLIAHSHPEKVPTYSPATPTRIAGGTMQGDVNAMRELGGNQTQLVVGQEESKLVTVTSEGRAATAKVKE